MLSAHLCLSNAYLLRPRRVISIHSKADAPAVQNGNLSLRYTAKKCNYELWLNYQDELRRPREATPNWKTEPILRRKSDFHLAYLNAWTLQDVGVQHKRDILYKFGLRSRCATDSKFRFFRPPSACQPSRLTPSKPPRDMALQWRKHQKSGWLNASEGPLGILHNGLPGLHVWDPVMDCAHLRIRISPACFSNAQPNTRRQSSKSTSLGIPWQQLRFHSDCF